MLRSHTARFESHVLGLLPVAGAQHKARQTGRIAGTGQAPLGVCLQSGRIAGRERFLFVHPWAAMLWNETCLTKLLTIGGTRRVRCDQCQFGMTSVDDARNVGPARKATRLMTIDEYIAEAVDRRCFGGHDHIQLLNGRAKACQKYLPRLVAAILPALR